MICDVCGRVNEDRLTFCQDCGKRLKAAAHVVAPTPPAGLPRLDWAAGPTVEAPSSSPSSRSRPAAPALEFAAADPHRPPADPPKIGCRCPSCGADNPPVHQYCVTCGKRLPEQSPLNVAAAPALNRADEPVHAAPVVNLPPDHAASPRRFLECARCHGQCPPDTTFCQFCGARLGSPASEGAKTADAAAPARVIEPSVRPVERPRGRLVLIVEDGSEGRSFSLDAPQIDIGRSEGDIRLEDDPYVSPRHARFVERGGTWFLVDLASTNKVFKRIRRSELLHDGDLLLLGLEVLQFQAVSNAERGLGHATEHGTLLFGSPASPRHARLCQRTTEGVTRDVYHLVRDETVIGREQGDLVFTGDPFLSRRHAVVSRAAESGRFSIADLDSSNGTYLAIRDDSPLSSGDFVRIGQHLFRVDLTSS